MSGEPESTEAQAQIDTEERAHRIRLQMIRNRGFQRSLAAGVADDEAERLVPWEEVRQQLGLD